MRTFAVEEDLQLLLATLRLRHPESYTSITKMNEIQICELAMDHLLGNPGTSAIQSTNRPALIVSRMTVITFFVVHELLYMMNSRIALASKLKQSFNRVFVMKCLYANYMHL